jgi:CHASE3 domain sensor protein
MKFRDKLMAGYLLVAALITMSGLFGIYGTEKIVTLLESKDMVVRSIVISASILARNAKKIESNLLIYLMLGNKEFKENYFRQVTELREAERSLRQVVQDPHGMRILDLVKSEIDLAVTAGRALLDSFDASVKTNSTYVASDHKDLITALVEPTTNIRIQAMKLADIETNFLNRQAAITASMEIVSYSKRLQGHLTLYLLLQNREDRRKVFDRYQSFYEMISILDDKLNQRI